MWNRELVKSEAKKALKRFYWIAVAVCLIFNFITGIAHTAQNFGTSFIGAMQSFTTSLTGAILEQNLFDVFPVFFAVFGVSFLLNIVISFSVYAFLINPISVGKYRFFLESRCFTSRFEQLFFSFSRGISSYKNIAITLFIRDIKVLLWGLLLVVPGIIKSYEYRMVPYLLSECPNMPHERAFELSRQMTDGEKFNMWVLDLSFIGWSLLCLLSCCIGYMFLAPYYEATWAEFYAAMREKAFGMGFSNQSELIGFIPQK